MAKHCCHVHVSICQSVFVVHVHVLLQTNIYIEPVYGLYPTRVVRMKNKQKTTTTKNNQIYGSCMDRQSMYSDIYSQTNNSEASRYPCEQNR